MARPSDPANLDREKSMTVCCEEAKAVFNTAVCASSGINPSMRAEKTIEQGMASPVAHLL